jgi:hypothetical protein
MPIDAALVSDDRARALAREILARAPYARFRSLDAPWFQDLLHALDRLLAWTRHLAVAAPAVYWLLVGSLLLVALALLAHVVWAVRAALAAGAPRRESRPGAEGPSLDAEASHLAATGRFLDAAHALHLACLETLLRAHTIELRRHDPNRVLRRRLAAAALPEEARREFLELLDRLEVRWFRDRAANPTDRDLYRDWRRLHDHLHPREAA